MNFSVVDLTPPVSGNVLFAAGRADLSQLPDQWTGVKLGRLAIALAWAGFGGDAATLISVQGHQLTDKHRDALHPDALARSTEDIRAAGAADTVIRLRPIALFAADAGIADATVILATAFADHRMARHLRAWLGCLWLGRLGRHAEAVAAFRSVPDTDSPDDLTVAAYLEALSKTHARSEAEAYLLRFAQRFDVSTLSLQNVVDCARAMTGAGKLRQARALLEALQDDTYGTPPRPVPATIHTTVTRLLYEMDAVNGRYHAALATLDRELARKPDSIPLICNRLHMLFRIGGPEPCIAAALPLLAQNPEATPVLSTLSMLPLPRAAKAQIYESMPPAAERPPMGTKLARVLLGLALKAGRYDEAGHLAHLVRDHDCLARLLLGGHLRPSERFKDTELPGSGFHVAAGPEGGPVVLVFLGGSGFMAYGLPVDHLDRFFEERGATAIYCVDSKARLFLHGIPGICDDINGVSAHLRQRPELRSAARVTTLGLSAGGFNAISLGLALGCDASLVYGTKTVIARPAPNIPDPAVERYVNLTRTIPPAHSDLRLQWSDDHFLAAELHFGQMMVLDRSHAERLSDRPGATLHPKIGGVEHDTFLPAIEHGQFQHALDRLLGLAPT